MTNQTIKIYYKNEKVDVIESPHYYYKSTRRDLDNPGEILGTITIGGYDKCIQVMWETFYCHEHMIGINKYLLAFIDLIREEEAKS